eukprot:PITA_28773
MVDPVNIVVILNLEVPRSVKQLRATLAHTRYYQKFIKSYAQITAPMEKLLKRDVTFCWNDVCKKSLNVLKEKLMTTPILVLPNWDKEFHIHVDASCIALGAVLTRDGGEGLDHPIVFTSCRLSKAKKSYSTTEREGLAMVWDLLFQEFDFEVVVKPGQLNARPDLLSHIEIGEEPTRYSVQQKKELVVHAANFYVIVGHLYNMGKDEILQGYLPEFERSHILADAHGGTARGHYAGKMTTQKILYVGFWWLILHQD